MTTAKNYLNSVYKKITIGHQYYYVPMSRSDVPNEEFQAYFDFAHRLMGYIVYPRWFAARMFLSECIEKLKRRGIYRQQVKKQTNALVKEMDVLEHKYTMDFDADFIDVMAGHMANEGKEMLNTLRGSIGGVLLNYNLKEYIFYSYPETFLVLASDNIRCYNQIFDEIANKHGIDYRCVFAPLEGTRVRDAGQLWLAAIESVVGENIPYGINGDGTLAHDHLVQLDRLMINYEKMKDAFVEGYNELSPEKQAMTESFIKNLSKQEEPQIDAAEILSTKYKVTKL